MKNKKLNSEEISFLCSQFAIILQTGVALHDGVEILLEDMESEKGKCILKKISDVLNDEKPLYMALDSAEVFPAYVINMVKIGELTGRLDEVLESLSDYFDSETKVKKSINDAIMQPMIILAMMFVVIVALVVKIIPVFEQIFRQFDPTLSAMISDSINISSTIGVVALIILGIVFVTVILVYVLYGIVKDSTKFEKILSHVPYISGFLYTYAITRFVNAMYLMIKSGVDTTTSIEYAMQLNTNKKMGIKLKECLDKLNNYEPFSDVISEAGIFYGVYKQMLKIAYKTGAYEQAWEKLCTKYNEEFDEKLSKTVALIEPILVAAITIIIGVVLVAVMLPLIKIMGNI